MSKQEDKLEELDMTSNRNIRNEQELDWLDDFIKKMQAELEDLSKRLATLHKEFESSGKAVCYDRIEETERLQIAFFETSMGLTECYAERARRVRALMKGLVKMYELDNDRDDEAWGDPDKKDMAKMKHFSVKTSELNEHLEGSIDIWTEALTSKRPKHFFIPD